MNFLPEFLSSRVKAEVLRLLFDPAGSELHAREIARRASLNSSTVRQELARLQALGLLNLRRSGNRAYYRANPAHPVFPDLRALVAKTSGVLDLLRSSLAGNDVSCAFVFGSIAGGLEKPESDVDLMVIGSVTLRGLSGRLPDASHQLGREINPHIFTPQEFAKRVRSGDHFVTTVMAGPKTFVIGDADDLERLGGKPLASPARQQPRRGRRSPERR